MNISLKDQGPAELPPRNYDFPYPSRLKDGFANFYDMGRRQLYMIELYRRLGFYD